MQRIDELQTTTDSRRRSLRLRGSSHYGPQTYAQSASAIDNWSGCMHVGYCGARQRFFGTGVFIADWLGVDDDFRVRAGRRSRTPCVSWRWSTSHLQRKVMCDGYLKMPQKCFHEQLLPTIPLMQFDTYLLILVKATFWTWGFIGYLLTWSHEWCRAKPWTLIYSVFS